MDDSTAEREAQPAPRVRRVKLLWLAGLLLLAYSVLLITTGGLDFMVGGVRIRSRSWQRPALLGLACMALVAVIDRRRLFAVLTHAGAGVGAWVVGRSRISARGVALTAVGWTAIAGLAFGTYVAGGADSSGYLNQARLFARGRILDEAPLPERPPWPNRALKLAPLGYRPAPDGIQLAPTYPPGYPLMMGPAFLIHEPAAYLVVPICGALAVWLTFALGRRIGDPAVGAAAASLVAVSPTFLYQLVQPMSDVPATAAWLLALLLAARGTTTSAALSGLVSGMAILTRPNLMPLAAIVWIACVYARRSPGGWRQAAAAAFATVPSVVILGTIQSIRYGSPFESGYGPTRDLFAWANIGPNLDRYPRWMFETHTPLIALFLLAPLWLARRRQESRFLFVSLWIFCVAVVAAYLPYMYFQPREWMYTRFLLPALPLMWLLALTPIADVLRRMHQPFGALVAVPAFVCLVLFAVHAAKDRYAFDLRDGERKYVDAAEYVQRALPANAVIVSMQHSGSIWFYARRPVLRWDYVERDELDSILAWLTDHGHALYIVADTEEIARLKERFAAAGQRLLDRAVLLTQSGDATIYAVR